MLASPGKGFISQIQRCIPNKWKKRTQLLDVKKSQCSILLNSNGPIEEKFTVLDEFMIDSLLTVLKDSASQHQLSKAFKTFALIKHHAPSSSYDVIPQSLSSLFLSCANLKLVPQGKQLHAQVISLGLERHYELVPKLVTFYSSLDLLVDARIITENSHNLHPLPWNLLISAYVRNGLCQEALSAYKTMLTKGVRCDIFTYPSVLKACAKECDIDFGKEVHKSIKGSCLEHNLFVQNALISMYGRCGELGVARDLFETMWEKDAVSWNSMIVGYASRGMWKNAFELFDIMRADGVELNIMTWNTIAGGCLRTGNFIGALKLLSQMRTAGIGVDYVAMIIGLGACSHIGVAKLGKEIHSSAIRQCYDGLDNVKNALITMYSRCGDLTQAHKLFQLIEAKNIITWNSMISGFAHMDRSEEASSLFREMLRLGVEPNYVTLASILPLCAEVANLQHGKEFHSYILRREEFKNYLLLWNALLDMYARSGKILDAKRVFELLSEKDEVTYTSLIAGYGMQGEGHTALRLFEEMNELQIKPDHVTMVAVLSACSHSGLVYQGELMFEKMQSVYGISPNLEHFACMIDLYGRAGLLKKAKDMLGRMPYRPTPAMWATLIGACRIHRNTLIGEWAAEKLLEARPKHSGYYVLIANMYAAAGCWDKLAKVRIFMRGLGVQKTPGCAWVDAGSGFHSFLVGDMTNPHAKRIHHLLDGLTELMRDSGYNATEEFSSDDCEEVLLINTG